MNPNSGWKATSSAPVGHAHGTPGSRSRRNMNTSSTVIAPISADRTRIAASLSSTRPLGMSLYGTAASA